MVIEELCQCCSMGRALRLRLRVKYRGSQDERRKKSLDLSSTRFGHLLQATPRYERLNERV